MTSYKSFSLVFLVSIFVLIFKSNNITSQEYQAVYDSEINMGKAVHTRYVLFIEHDQWVLASRILDFKSSIQISSSLVIMSDNMKKQKNTKKLNENKSFTDFSKYSLKDSIAYESIDIMNHKYILEYKMKQPDWFINMDSIKVISNHNCYLATANIYGRDYKVWFAPEIPVKAGIKKLWGLPGLLVSAVSNDGEFKYYLRSFSQANTMYPNFKMKNIVSRAELIKKVKIQKNRMERYFSTLSEGGSCRSTLSFEDKTLMEEINEK
ncbi:MAG: GLPGLI family protein [Bacteroidales bacterium]